MANGINGRNGNGSFDRINSLWALVLSLLSALAGFGGAMIYVGGSLRQIDVNTQSIRDISEHGTGILQALKQQVNTMSSDLDGVKIRAQSIAINEQHLHAVDQRLDHDEILINSAKVEGAVSVTSLGDRVGGVDKRLAVMEQLMVDVRAKLDQRDLMQRDMQRDIERAQSIGPRAQ